MNVVIYDEDKQNTNLLMAQLSKVRKDFNISIFSKKEDLLKSIEQRLPEIIIVSWNDGAGRGYFLTKQIRQKYPISNVIVTAKEFKDGVDLFKLRISGFLKPPYDIEDVEYELGNLRYKIDEIENKVIY